MRSLVACCLASFRSDTWSVRNAGLQLFGALAPRVLGQKKVRDDAGGYNQVNIIPIELPVLLTVKIRFTDSVADPEPTF